MILHLETRAGDAFTDVTLDSRYVPPEVVAYRDKYYRLVGTAVYREASFAVIPDTDAVTP